MSLVKREYVDHVTVITADNLNDIQDAIIENEEAIEDLSEDIEGKYTKPSGGIPKTDLASGVQQSLDKADSALQAVPNTYRTAAAQDLIDADKVDKADYNPESKTSAMTQQVGVDANGKLWTQPAAAAAQSDWSETDTTSPAFIKNKPTIPDISQLESDVQDLQDIAGDGALDSDFTATDLTGAANELKTSLTQEATTRANADAALQTAVNGKVNKSGDTMTGSLRVKTSMPTTLPSSGYYNNIIIGMDSGNEEIAGLQTAYETSGNRSVAIQAQKYINGTFKFHNLRIAIDAEGNAIVSGNAPAWRKFLNVPQIKKVTQTLTTDQYGQAIIQRPVTYANFVNAFSEDYRYFVVKQDSLNLRVFNVSPISYAANISLSVTVIYTEA